MNLERNIVYWTDGAKDDLVTAELLIRNQRLLHGLFWCHLVLEKMLKAHIVKITGNYPPKTHNLFWLLEKTNIEITDEIKDFLGILSKYQLEGRYPEYEPVIPANETALNYLNETTTLYKWLTRIL